MKKNSLLKALLIVFGIYVVLTWIIPAGYFSSGEFVDEGTSPVGIFDLIIYPLITGTSSVFILTALAILCIGGLYGVLNKTGAYGKKLDQLAKKWKGREKTLLIIISVIFALMASLTGLTLPLFVFVPFAATLLLLVGYNKITAMLSTIGAILVGNMASIYGFNVAGYVSYLTNDINDSIWLRILTFVLALGLLIFALIKNSKLEKKVSLEEIPLYDKNIDKKSNIVPLVVMSCISTIILFVGMFNWNGVFGIELFDNIHDAITSFEIGGYDLFNKLIGTIPAFGSWTNYELCFVLVVTTLIIGKLYKLNIQEIVDSAKEGMKEILPVALWTIACNIIFLLMNADSNGYTIYSTIANAILGLSSNIYTLTLSIASVIGSIFYNDFPYFLSAIYSPSVAYSENYTLIGIITQLIHGLVQLIAPTSVILVAGLTYFKVSYTKWLKNIWKLLVGLLVIVIIIIILTALFA